MMPYAGAYYTCEKCGLGIGQGFRKDHEGQCGRDPFRGHADKEVLKALKRVEKANGSVKMYDLGTPWESEMFTGNRDVKREIELIRKELGGKS